MDRGASDVVLSTSGNVVDGRRTACGQLHVA